MVLLLSLIIGLRVKSVDLYGLDLTVVVNKASVFNQFYIFSSNLLMVF